MEAVKPIGPGRCLHIFGGLPTGIRIDFDGVNPGIGVALGQHERNEPGARAYIQYRLGMVHIHPGTQHNAIGAHFHGALVLVHLKLFELKERRSGGCFFHR